MYSTDFFVAQFQKIDTDTLIEKLATQELTDEAREALTLILGDRGFEGDHLDRLVHQSKKDQYLKTGADNRCDFCGKAMLPPSFSVGGQKFCNVDCFHTSRLRQASVDISDAHALQHARHLKLGPCPRCAKPHQKPDMYKSHFITSMVVLVTTSIESAFTCKSCANRNNLRAILFCVTLGWWSLKGLVLTPFHVISNIREILRKRESLEPSIELVDLARLRLADAHLKATSGGRYGLRA
jgi:hypothetical protein